jgi:hypothetical protein
MAVFCPACERQGLHMRLVRAGYTKRPQGGTDTLYACPAAHSYTAAELRDLNPPPLVDQLTFEFATSPAAEQAAVPERLL